MEWYTVEDHYMNYLRNHESRIPRTDYGVNKFKPFFGELFEVGDLIFITQVSHPQSRHWKIRENVDFAKLYDGKRLIAVVNLNYMFPVHKNRLIKVTYKNIENFRLFKTDDEKSNYITLLKKEKKQIITKNINKKAFKLYKHKYDYPLDKISKRCIDFKNLEQICKEYETIQIKNTTDEEIAVF